MEFKSEKELSLFEINRIENLYVVSRQIWFYPEIFVIIRSTQNNKLGSNYRKAIFE